MGDDSTGHRTAEPPPPGAPKGRLEVEVVRHCDGWRGAGLDEGLLARAAEEALRAALGAAEGTGSAPAEVAVVLSDDDEVRALNATWRGKDEPTNVLSFPLAAGTLPPAGARVLGDIVLAFETVSAEARAKGLSLDDHAAHLVVHGLLHLIGHDHQTDDEARAMEALERRVLAGLGIADPYHCEADSRNESALTAGVR